ncbi:MAG: orotidine-5'-phosphate decarboxylase [Saprospiraceae bacterium]|nr:orotidine-5'-phosphate decarboxylase [Saprospiraceae bacterium]
MKRNELIHNIQQKKSMLCVGLDPELRLLPAHLLEADDPVFEFNKQIIDATKPYCVAYKPNLAFYEALGPNGWITFQKTVEYIGSSHFIIADAKRGDIGNTGRLYAETFFNRYHCDAVTVAPYMGEDSVAPFISEEGKWAIVLALTSNQGSSNFQKLSVETSGLTIWETVLMAVQQWGTPDQVMFVVGATHPEAFIKVRSIVPDHFLLVPGVGAQGGDLDAICRVGMNRDGGLLINASRSILYAGKNSDFAEKSAEEARRLQQQMAIYLS